MSYEGLDGMPSTGPDDLELSEGGKDMCITKENFPKFVDLVTEFSRRTGSNGSEKGFL